MPPISILYIKARWLTFKWNWNAPKRARFCKFPKFNCCEIKVFYTNPINSWWCLKMHNYVLKSEVFLSRILILIWFQLKLSPVSISDPSAVAFWPNLVQIQWHFKMGLSWGIKLIQQCCLHTGDKDFINYSKNRGLNVQLQPDHLGFSNHCDISAHQSRWTDTNVDFHKPRLVIFQICLNQAGHFPDGQQVKMTKSIQLLWPHSN